MSLLIVPLLYPDLAGHQENKFLIFCQRLSLVWIVLIDPKPTKDAGATGAAFVYFDDVTDGYNGVRVELKAI